MWITKKKMDKIMEKALESERMKFQSELTSKQFEISRLKTELAMKDLEHAIMGLELKITELPKPKLSDLPMERIRCNVTRFQYRRNIGYAYYMC